MGASNDAVSFIFASLVSMEPMAAEIVKGMMSDLAVKASPISRDLSNVTFWGACTWHIMAIDFPQNVGHVPDYENLKDYVYKNLVRNTTSSEVWNECLSHGYRTWPMAASYLQEMAKEKTRLGAPWRLIHFTVGCEASSAVEGSFFGILEVTWRRTKIFHWGGARSCPEGQGQISQRKTSCGESSNVS